MNLPLKVPLQKVTDSLLEEKGLDVFIKREDLIHKRISGNKWRKLHYCREHCITQLHMCPNIRNLKIRIFLINVKKEHSSLNYRSFFKNVEL